MQKIGLALSGGGVKGAAHIGVLKALEEAGIYIECISGTSSGSIVASLYACGYTPDEIEEFFYKHGKDITGLGVKSILKYIRAIMSKKFKISGLISGEFIEKVITNKCNEKGFDDICDLKMKIAIPVVDVNTGKVYVYNNAKINDNNRRNENISNKIEYLWKEKIGKVVRASSTFPGIFIPCTISDKEMVDGGVRCNVPVSVLKLMGADKTIAISFDYPDTSKENPVDNVFEIISQSFSILSKQASIYELEQADLIIRPYVPEVKLLDMSKIKKCINEGYEITKRNINDIKALLS